MHHQIWAINLLLLATVVGALVIATLWEQEAFFIESIRPVKYQLEPKRETRKINIKTIYENDLFGTYHIPIEAPKQLSLAKPIPTPPTPKQATHKEKEKPTLMAPISLTLKGIIVANQPSQNMAIVADNQTKKERSISVGDKIEDAQLIKIMNNKIIFLRSNGQQDVLYLREEESKGDAIYNSEELWKTIARRVDDKTIAINRAKFAQTITSLAQLIDLLDLSGVYKEGKSIGCAVGKLVEKVPGELLDLQKGDIITSVAGISIAGTADRLQAYKTVISAKLGDRIEVGILRGNKTSTFDYLLESSEEAEESLGETEDGDKKTEAKEESKMVVEGPSEKGTEQEKIRLLKDRYKFAPTLQEIKMADKRKMLTGGSKQKFLDKNRRPTAD